MQTVEWSISRFDSKSKIYMGSILIKYLAEQIKFDQSLAVLKFKFKSNIKQKMAKPSEI